MSDGMSLNKNFACAWWTVSISITIKLGHFVNCSAGCECGFLSAQRECIRTYTQTSKFLNLNSSDAVLHFLREFRTLICWIVTILVKL